MPDTPVHPPLLTMGTCMSTERYEEMICGMSARLVTTRTFCASQTEMSAVLSTCTHPVAPPDHSGHRRRIADDVDTVPRKNLVADAVETMPRKKPPLRGQRSGTYTNYTLKTT